MKYFSTGFFLESDSDLNQILGTCISWVLKSPHTSFSEDKLTGYTSDKEFDVESKNENIAYIIFENEKEIISTFRYSKLSPPNKWITDISVNKNKEDRTVWVQVESEVITQNVSYKKQNPKKPLIVLQLIEKFSGGIDGELPMSINPIYLSPERPDALSQAKRIINSEIKNRLPIVYVSTRYNYKEHAHNVIPERLSRKLCGLAHVVVEPTDTSFSHKLKYDVDFKNAYGGAVGVYWPNNQGISFHRRKDSESKYFENEIYQEVLSAISTLSPLKKCGWNEVYNSRIRNSIEILKRQQSPNNNLNDELVKLYENENETLIEEIEYLKQKTYQLEARISSMQSKSPRQGDISLLLGTEVEFFDDEAVDFLIHHLESTIDGLNEKSRYRDIITSIIEHNRVKSTIAINIQKLKKTLVGYKKMDAKTRGELKNIGFEIDESKHYKITYYGDPRYYYTLPKTGSDHRGSKNAYSDISKMIFY